jgi:thiamine pyrophosphokinase
VSRLPVSGGTAPFFELLLQGSERDKKSHKYYIGKDLSHTQDEVAFHAGLGCRLDQSAYKFMLIAMIVQQEDIRFCLTRIQKYMCSCSTGMYVLFIEQECMSF